MAGESRCWPVPVAAVLSLHAAPTGTLADSEQLGRARSAKPSMSPACPTPSSSAVLPMRLSALPTSNRGASAPGPVLFQIGCATSGTPPGPRGTARAETKDGSRCGSKMIKSSSEQIGG